MLQTKLFFRLKKKKGKVNSDSEKVIKNGPVYKPIYLDDIVILRRERYKRYVQNKLFFGNMRNEGISFVSLFKFHWPNRFAREGLL